MPANQPHLLKNIDNIEQFEALFNFATIGIVVTDSKGLIINFNKYAEAQFGYTRQEVLGKVVDVLLPDSARAAHVKYRQQYYNHPEPRSMGHGRDLFAKNKNGDTFPVEVSLSHYLINNETFVIAFVIDITVRKHHELIAAAQTRELERVTAEIKSMNAQLEQKIEARTKMLREALAELERSKEELNLALENERELGELKSRFVTMASHEFRTPLSTILSSAYLLEKYNQFHPDPKMEKHLDRIKGAVSGMKNILEDFLSLGRLEEGLVQTNPEELSSAQFIEMINEFLHEMEALLKRGQKISFLNAVNRDIRIDRNHIKNILINLVSNAIKFTDEYGSISLIASEEGKTLSITVEDNGIGIPLEDQQHLFQRFFRARNAANIQGTGLGLHIVAKYLELLGGTITMKSKLNEGTAFTVNVPNN